MIDLRALTRLNFKHFGPAARLNRTSVGTKQNLTDTFQCKGPTCSAVRSRHCPSVTPRRFETTSQIVIGGTGGHSITLQGSPVTGFERLQKRLGLIGKVFPKSSKSSEKFTFIAAASSTRFKPHFLEETRASGSASAMPFFTVSCRAATCLSNECEGQLFKM